MQQILEMLSWSANQHAIMLVAKSSHPDWKAALCLTAESLCTGDHRSQGGAEE